LKKAILAEEQALQLIWPWRDRQRRFSWLKASTFALMFAPAIWVAYQFGNGQYGFYPMALGGLTYWSGVWATAVLLLALAVTPALRIFRWGALIDVRRMIGVAALVYTIVHIVIYFPLRLWNFAFIANELVTRATLVAATLSTIGLIALGVTSVDAAIRRMGAKNWQRLHNAVYAVNTLAIVHVVISRGTAPEQYMLAGVFLWLMVWRVLDRYGLGTDAKALMILTVASSLFTAFLEAIWVWGRRGYEISWTLGNNFTLDLGVPPAWQVFVLGMPIVVIAAILQAPRLRPARLEARKIG
jgi:sulfoxide reductase heme-binding subunit YedZ